MSDTPFHERRRVPRFDIHLAALAELPAAMNVRVREISVRGVLLHGTAPLPVGTTGSLRMTMGGVPFSVDIHVQRVGVRRGAGDAVEIAAAFVAISPEQRHMIERFVKQ